MIKNDEQEQEAPGHLRWGRLPPLLLCLILIVGGMLVWQIASHAGNASNGGGPASAATTPPATGSSGPPMPPVPLTAMYDEIVKDQVAQGLHLTVAQVTAQLQAEPTPDLRRIGKQQNLSQDQLYRLVLNALQTADSQMVTSHTWTKPQADEEMGYWSQQTQLALINGVASWFVQQ